MTGIFEPNQNRREAFLNNDTSTMSLTMPNNQYGNSCRDRGAGQCR
jgi:hypothetical protein